MGERRELGLVTLFFTQVSLLQFSYQGVKQNCYRYILLNFEQIYETKCHEFTCHFIMKILNERKCEQFVKRCRLRTPRLSKVIKKLKHMELTAQPYRPVFIPANLDNSLESQI